MIPGCMATRDKENLCVFQVVLVFCFSTVYFGFDVVHYLVFQTYQVINFSGGGFFYRVAQVF